MSRSSYTDDYGDEFPGQINLYRANVDRSIRSKAGQARLRELRDALLRLPTKALEQDIFAEGDKAAPRVCALGAWALDKQGGDPEAARAMLKDGRDADDLCTAKDLAPHGWPKLVVMEAIFENTTKALGGAARRQNSGTRACSSGSKNNCFHETPPAPPLLVPSVSRVSVDTPRTTPADAAQRRAGHRAFDMGRGHMKALSLTQPWATLIAIGAKRIETRSWSTSFRGVIAIHASKGFPRDCQELCADHPFRAALGAAFPDRFDATFGLPIERDCGLPRGAIVAVARLHGVARTEDILGVADMLDRKLLPHEIEFGDYSDGRFGWVLDDVRPLPQPIPCKGALGLWTVPPEIKAQIGAMAA